MSKRAWMMSWVVAWAGGSVACDNAGSKVAPSDDALSASDHATGPSDDALSAPDTADTAAPLDGTSDTTATADTGPTPLAYPEGPYGRNYNTIIENLTFYDPWSGQTRSLAELHNDPTKTVVVLTSAAGWCTACNYEAWDLTATYTAYKDSGLEIFYTIYEDRNGKAIWRPGASQAELDKDLTFLNSWRTTLGVPVGLPKREANFPVLVDDNFKLAPYYPEDATPLTIIVRLRDMRILYRNVGYAEGSINGIVKSYLNQR